MQKWENCSNRNVYDTGSPFGLDSFCNYFMRNGSEIKAKVS